MSVSDKDDLFGRRQLPYTPWRNRNPIGRFLSSRFDVDSPKGLIPIVAALLLGALLLLGGQAAFGTFDNEPSHSKPLVGAPSGNPDSHPPTEHDPFCDLGDCPEPKPTVMVVLGKEKFAKLTDSMLDNLFCYNPTSIKVECDRAQHQRILKQVLTAAQLAFLDEHDIDTSTSDWKFLSEGSTAVVPIGLPNKPTQSYNEMHGTVVLMNP